MLYNLFKLNRIWIYSLAKNVIKMSKIIKLDKNLANQIAAWEVVERPVSVVKELVENSIDAGAQNIKIDITNWWIDQIIINDDWEWINKDDLNLVVEKHTTSKIKSLTDLYNVMTFGFRWEALSSISSVSNIEIISRTIEDNFWYNLWVDGWEKKEIIQIASEIWTKIIVKNLFYNTPARLNYLKKPRTEYNHILEFLNNISLSYPQVWFEFISDNKTIFKYKNWEDLSTRIYNIYGEEFSSNLLEINFELSWIKLTGYISDPKVSFANKNRQNLFINKRIIKSGLIYKAISDAYNRFIPHSNFPAYVLNLEVDPTQVDVNVHPRKLEVRFAQESTIFRAFYHGIHDKLESVSLVWKDDNVGVSLVDTLGKREMDTLGKREMDTLGKKGKNIGYPQGIPLQKEYYTWSWTKFKSYSPYSNKDSNPSQREIWNSINFTKEILDNNKVFDSISSDLHDTALWKIIGQAHNSYIIVETKEWIKFLDQHALAERVIYEKLIASWVKVQTQWLLIGETFDLTPRESDILQENLNTFNEMWFDFEIISWNTIILNGIPDFIIKEDVQKIFYWILEDIWSANFTKSSTLDEVKNKIYAYAACRSAIKFWNKLNLFEMNKLLNDSVLDYSSTCPHGRPVVFEISLNELKDKYER